PYWIVALLGAVARGEHAGRRPVSAAKVPASRLPPGAFDGRPRGFGNPATVNRHAAASASQPGTSVGGDLPRAGNGIRRHPDASSRPRSVSGACSVRQDAPEQIDLSCVQADDSAPRPAEGTF